MPIPAGRLTFQQIRDLAVRKAGNPALGVPLAAGPSPATLYLTQILYDLYTQYEWPECNTSLSLVLTGPTFPLPGDFIESQDDYALQIYNTNGLQEAATVLEVAPDKFNAMAATQATGTIPVYWTADRNAGIGRLFPDCTGNVSTANFRYRFLPVAETTPPPSSNWPIPPGVGEATINAVVPVFPNSRYLIQALFVECLQYERDPRYTIEIQVLEQMKKQVLQGSAVFQAQSNTIPLDADVFRQPFRNDNISGG
jgi:hypothetical protein